MESNSLPRMIHMSDTAAGDLKAQSAPGEFDIVSRGLISVKGKGDMHTYFLRYPGCPDLGEDLAAKAASPLNPLTSANHLVKIHTHKQHHGPIAAKPSFKLNFLQPSHPKDHAHTSSVRTAFRSEPGSGPVTPQRVADGTASPLVSSSGQTTHDPSQGWSIHEEEGRQSKALAKSPLGSTTATGQKDPDHE